MKWVSTLLLFFDIHSLRDEHESGVEKEEWAERKKIFPCLFGIYFPGVSLLLPFYFFSSLTSFILNRILFLDSLFLSSFPFFGRRRLLLLCSFIPFLYFFIIFSFCFLWAHFARSFIKRNQLFILMLLQASTSSGKELETEHSSSVCWLTNTFTFSPSPPHV